MKMKTFQKRTKFRSDCHCFRENADCFFQYAVVCFVGDERHVAVANARFAVLAEVSFSKNTEGFVDDSSLVE